MDSHQDLSAVLFDLDGTLIDSIELILRSYEHTLAAHGKPRVDRAALVGSLGTPLWTHLGEFATDPAEIDAMVVTYRAWNHEHHDELVVPYPGVDAALERLSEREVPMAIVTSKASEHAWRGMRLCGIAQHFEILIGSDDVERHKPHPEPVLTGAERLGHAPETCAYVGDSVHDVASARAAGAHAVAVGWGPFPHDALHAAGAHALFQDPAELTSLVPAQPSRSS